MLPILVLLLVSSAFAAPSITQVRQVPASDRSYIENSLVGRAVSGFDAGEANLNSLNIDTILKDLSKQGGNQALTNGQLVAYLGEVSTGRPGDSCAAANYVNAYTRNVASGNSAGLREALGNYISVVADNIDNIVGRLTNPESVKFTKGRRGGCSGEGRSYQFEAAWDIILGSAAPQQQSLINEEYCVAKRLYCAFSALSNNLAAQVTASALPPSVQVFELCSGQLDNFLRSMGTKSNLAQSGASLKRALTSAVGQVAV